MLKAGSVRIRIITNIKKEKKERKFQKERTDNLFETLLEETRTDCNGKVVPKVFIDVIRPQRKE